MRAPHTMLIKNGSIVTSTKIFKSDILIKNGIIAKIGDNLQGVNEEVLDAANMLIFPGFIDSHTHLDMDTPTAHTADTFKTGTKAAIEGGTTTIIDFATQNKGETLMHAVENWHKLADNQCYCDYAFHMAITDWNTKAKEQIPLLTKEGITSYKIYFAYDALRVSDKDAYEILTEVKKQGGITGAHCENGDLVNALTEKQRQLGNLGTNAHPKSRPDIVEAEAVNRFLTIASLTEAEVNVVHLSSKTALEVVLNARNKGVKAYIETCPQYLLLTEENYSKENFEGAKYVMSPPLRKKEDTQALWEATINKETDTIATDHCSYLLKDKALGKSDFSKIPNGAPGVDARPQLIYTYGVKKGKITESDMCRLLCENPAKLFGLYSKKGVIKEGSIADIVVWNPSCEGVITDKNQKTACDYTPYNNFKVRGQAKYVFLLGNLVATEGQATDKKMGRYVKRDACTFLR